MLLASAVALSLVGCRPDEAGTHVAGWSIADPAARHPILVSQQPSSLNMRIPRGAYGLSPHQRAQVAQFVDRYRTADSGNSKLVISAPSGAANEVASMQAVAEIRYLLRDIGFDETAVTVEAYHEERDPQPPVRISYLRYVAEGPNCGRWPTNLARQPDNLSSPNLGCAQQQNLAAQVANPGDLLGPRTRTPATGERRQVIWEKYTKGESTISQKQGEEKVQVKGAN
jgi:pilus assembly protein CpaD